MIVENMCSAIPNAIVGIIIKIIKMTNGKSFSYCPPSLIQSLRVIHYGSEKFDPCIFTPIKNYPKDNERGGIKPDGGLWTSPENSDLGFENYCLNERIKCSLSQFFHLKFQPETRILLIDSYKDLETMPMRTDNSRWVNWEKLSEICDAVWLTSNGLDETILSSPYHLCGWDCETVLIMNPKCCYSV